MRTNLSSQISLNRVSPRYYRPENAIERSVLTRLEKIPTNIYESIEEGTEQIANEIVAKIQDRQREGKFCTIAIGTGASLRYLFTALIRKHKDEGVSFRNVVFFNLYEYYPLTEEAGSSFNHLNKLFLSQIDIDRQNVFTLDGTIPQDAITEHCRLYEQRIQTFGGLDIAVMGIGREGNIGMNEPGSYANSMTRLILIDSTSRAEASHNIGVDNLPPCSITMGIGTILSARKVYVMAWGENKADIIRQTVEDKMSDTLPASYLQLHSNATICVDLAAAAHLTRIQRPWLVTSCEWNDKLVRSAIVWLCLKLKKPILKLTNKDYNENGLSELLALYGSAYNANIKVFNDLQHTITGWPGGKPNADDTYRPERAKPFPKRVIVFSPHPDDDVISMGGTLRRLVQQGHEVHVAYETSGNIAVGDEEVVRFMHFINGFNQLFANSEDKVISEKYAEIKNFFANKKEGDMDTRDILTIKGLIRRGEARTACTYNKIPLSRCHFLDLPFYETGKIEKNPISEKDIEVVLNLLREVKPHQIYVAGDLADPHGTHRVCTDAVFAAIDEEKNAGAEWLNDCRIWMYRGAWAEWEIENIEMCVPLSPEELRAKRNSILKHQSQMESAPFLGNDERLFWQRSEDRNRGTASLYDQLGLASYEAMEAFVEYKPI
ncbi:MULTISPECIES: glucosamine-6-phosphate deaminase [Bacteroides]|uniref:Glucosamine-6-phosphate deaminase n=2 Tax=Bacteroidaceae TaxID=815 RepID=A0ABT7VEN2_9BACE|nr:MULTISPECIES: glucosamine-6-phosphate deaminase [Bacteroides]MBU3856667.1 glucosamine-6-phosphate deaminase [Candidatus Phocaeicola excrementipullorum]MBW9200477.1 glucosamine-6-phosphate deaminase [Bacteroidales bacterium SW299]MCR8917009.1 glucosamine-6-phosphate deaminase [Bacteroides sp. ET225]MDM8206983.1 glucosamine-6-phosphate deaminase [Bacteroides gallinaceum]MDM8324769.1 glucosamine-6-phosphate deaminase [Bacteroides gallinaceum]